MRLNRWQRPAPVIAPMRLGTTWRAPLEERFVAVIAALPEDEQAAVLWRLEYCARFLALEGAGLARRSERSLNAASDRIYVELERLADEEVASAARYRSGRPWRGGTRYIVLWPPHPGAKALRSWIERFEKTDDPLALRDRNRRSEQIPRSDSGASGAVGAPAVRHARLGGPVLAPPTVEELAQARDRELTRKEAERYLPASTPIIRALIEYGHLPTRTEWRTFGPQRFLRGEDVIVFRETYGTLTTLAKEIGVHPLTLKNNLEENCIAPAFDPQMIGARIYRRDTVTATLSEAAMPLETTAQESGSGDTVTANERRSKPQRR